MPGSSLFWRRARGAEPVDPAALQRRLNAAAELLEADRLVLLLDDPAGPVTLAAAAQPEGPEPDGPFLSAPITRAGVQVGVVHATRGRGERAFEDADLWLLEALAAQLSSDQPRFTRSVGKDMRR